MKASVLALGFVSCAAFTSAQTLEWVVPLDVDIPANYQGMAMTATAEGYVFVIGPSANALSYGSDLFGDLRLQHFDAAGQVLSFALFQGLGTVNELVEHEGSLYMVGKYKDEFQFPGQPLLSTAGQIDAVGSFVCRMNYDGSVIWVKEIGDIGPRCIAQALSIHSDGTLFIAAWDFIDSYILLVDGAGDPIETWTLNGVAIVSAIGVNAEGIVAVAGSCMDQTADLNGSTATHSAAYTTFGARFSPNGILMDHLIIEDITCAFPGMVIDQDGGYFLAAHAFLETAVGPFMLQEPEWSSGEFVVHVDAQGEVEWLQQPQAGSTIGDVTRGEGNDLALRPDGGLWQGGMARGTNDWGNGITTSSSIPGSAMFLWQMDGDGVTQQVITSDGSNYQQTAHSLATVGNDVLYVLSSAYDTLEVGGVIIPAAGSNLYLSRCSGLSTDAADHDASASVFVHPNPATTRLSIDLYDFSGPARIDVLDMQGRLIRTERTSSSTPWSFDVSELRAGTYQLRVQQGEHLLRARFVKQ